MLKSALLLLFTSVLLYPLNVHSENLYPTSIPQLRETSVKIVNLDENSGGTGSIFRSFSNATHILTNKHICRLIEPGGYVLKGNRKFLITHYKKYPNHDLCLVRIAVGLGINTNVALEMPEIDDISVVSGHPQLLPHIVSKGHFTDEEQIQLLTAIRKCTSKDLEENPEYCLFLGGMPVIETFNSQVVSNLIAPGNSGSAVYNSEGEISGVVFAGYGRGLSFGFIVPHMYVAYFLDNAQQYNWVEVGSAVAEDEIYIDRIFNFNKCQKILESPEATLEKVKNICRSIQNNMVWINK